MYNPSLFPLFQAGSVIRLFHREIECYVVAEGSFAEQPESALVEDVHLRKRKSDFGKLKAPSTSAITYWVIEKKKDSRIGQSSCWVTLNKTYCMCSSWEHISLLLSLILTISYPLTLISFLPPPLSLSLLHSQS